jgi:hypothetical protein
VTECKVEEQQGRDPCESGFNVHPSHHFSVNFKILFYAEKFWKSKSSSDVLRLLIERFRKEWGSRPHSSAKIVLDFSFLVWYSIFMKHKIEYKKSGSENGYWTAFCSCGWTSKVWTQRKASVVIEVKNHKQPNDLPEWAKKAEEKRMMKI